MFPVRKILVLLMLATLIVGCSMRKKDKNPPPPEEWPPLTEVRGPDAGLHAPELTPVKMERLVAEQ